MNEFFSAVDYPGEMADRVRALDWKSTPLGPMESWPRSLRSSVELILASRFPMFLLWGPRRVIIYNDSYVDVLGDKHPNALGQPFAELWGEVIDQIGPIIDASFANRPSYFTDLPVVLKRHGYDEQAYFTFSYSPVRGDGAAIDGALCVLAETTETVRLKQRQQDENDKLRQLFENAPGFAAIVSGPTHIFEMCNAAYESLVGGRPVLGLPLALALPETVEQGFVQIIDDVYATRQPFVGREVLYRAPKTPGGPLEEVYVDFIFQPVLGAARDVVGVFIQGHEITEQVLARQALVVADRQKDQFIATLAHELRNPLAPISAAAHLLQRPGITLPAGAKAAEVINRQIGQMSRLLDDLLDVARIARNQMTLKKERCRADDLINLAVEAARPALDAKRHQLTIDMGAQAVELEVDKVRIVQILSNILVNAAKYTNDGGAVTLASSIEGGNWCLRVRDNGIGMRLETLSKVFDMFAQDSATIHRSQGGLGIGLGLAKALAELHGGSIEADSEGADRGSIFTLRVPALNSTTGNVGEIGDARHTLTTPALSILLVDDNQDLVDIVGATLRAMGHNVTTAYDGIAGLDAYRRTKPDVAVLDIGMPKLNGFDLARSIRAVPGGGEVLLIAATGWGSAAHQAEAQNAGFNAHLTKPFPMESLLALLGNTGVSTRAVG